MRGAILVLTMFVRISVFCASDASDCDAVAEALKWCDASMKSGEFFMRIRSACCKSLEDLETNLRDNQITSRRLCECLNNRKETESAEEYDALSFQSLLEVYALCGPRLPFAVDLSSDCAVYNDDQDSVPRVITTS